MKIEINDIIHFTKYSETGKWEGNGKGRVMAIDKTSRILVSVHEHPLYKNGELVQLYPWGAISRFTPDVITKKEEK